MRVPSKAALNVGAAVGGPANAIATLATTTTTTATASARGIPDLCSRLMCCAALSTISLTTTQKRPYEGGNTPCASASRFDWIVQGFGRLRALGRRYTTGVSSPNARSLPPTSRSTDPMYRIVLTVLLQGRALCTCESSIESCAERGSSCRRPCERHCYFSHHYYYHCYC